MAETLNIFAEAESISNDQNRVKHHWSNHDLPNKIKDLKFSGEVEIAYSKTEKKKLVFENCIFDIISIKNEHDEQIEEIKFINCQISSVRFFQSGITIVFESTSVQSIDLVRCDIPKMKIEGSEVMNIFFESNSKINEVLITNDSHVEKIDSKDADVNKLEIHSSHVECVHINCSINLLDIKEGAVLDRFSIDNKEELKKFLKTMKNKLSDLRGGTVSQKKVELRHQKQIILAAYNQYVDENRFQEMDICLVRLRKINCRLNRISTNNPFQKVGYGIEDFILGKMFGWGVQIINSLITSAIIIVAFAVVYFEALKSSIENVWQCIQISLAASVNRFFNANEVAPISILEHFDTAEQIIGVIILTIFTGVIARKIIR